MDDLKEARTLLRLLLAATMPGASPEQLREAIKRAEAHLNRACWALPTSGPH